MWSRSIQRLAQLRSRSLRDLSPEEAGYLDLIGFVLVGDQNGVMHQEAERANLELKGSSVRNIVTDKGSVFLLKFMSLLTK